jgi:hypothetical protein
MNMTPIAQSLAAQGRNGDTMLVHMTPNEVGGLQTLAQSAGGSLSINPETGMPEANFLESILPVVIGLGITAATGGAAAPWMVGAGVGGGTALLTGDLNKGLMAGLGAFGGAGLGSSLMGIGAGGSAGALGALGDEAVVSGLTSTGANIASATTPGFGASLSQMGSGVSQAMANPGAFGSQLVSNLGGPLGAGAAGLGILGGFDSSNQSSIVEPTTSTDSPYEGPYMPVEREVKYPTAGGTSTSEFNYFTPSNPTPGYQTFAQGGMAQGFQTFGGERATDNMYAFNPDSREFRNEAEKLRILGRQTGAGIPMNISGIDMKGEPIYETSYNIPGITEEDISAVRDGLGITNIRGDLESIRKDLANAPAPLTFRDMTDNDMDYLKSVLDINPSPESVVNPPTPSPSTPTFTPRPDAPATAIGPSAPSAVTPPPVVQPPPTSEEIYVQPPPTPEPEPEAQPEAEKGFTSYLDYVAGDLNRKFGFNLPTGSPATPAPAPAPARNVDVFGNEEPDAAYWESLNQEGAAAGGVIRKAPGGLASITGGEFMEDGSFVIDARTVSELGNGSSNAGLELLMRLGGRPVEGPGDGVSDSIPATIDGTQDAAVARDEVIFTPQAVAAIGGGDAGRGRELLYEMMRQAEKARKEVDRGEDSGAGLKALSMAGAV